VALIVLDASVLIAHLDPGDPVHENATAALLQHANDDLRLPASAYAESLVDPARKGRLDEAREKIAALGFPVVPLDESMAARAAGLRARGRQLRLPDALVLACGEELGADAVLTADRHLRRFRGVQLVT
jgi:predicted nucleic acid-binding protein